MLLDVDDPECWTLGAALAAAARRWPARAFLESAESGETVSFGDAHARAARRAAALAAHGVASASRIGLMASNSLAALDMWFALNLAGAIDVCLNPAHRGAVLEHLVNLSGIRTLIVEPHLLPVLRASEAAMPALAEILWLAPEDAAAVPPEVAFERIEVKPLASLAPQPGWQPPALAGSDVASVLFTSGTSGPAKGVMVRHAHAVLSARLCVEGARMTEADRLYCFHPFFHMAAKHCGVLSSLLAGACCVVGRMFDAATWIDTVHGKGITIGLGHGPMLEMIHRQPPRGIDAATRLTRMIAAPLPAHIARDFERRFRLRGIEIWGMTEIGLPCWRPWDEPLVPGSAGQVSRDWYEVRVCDPVAGHELPAGAVGELRVRPRFASCVMAGYLGDAPATAAAWDGEWFRTGDAGRMDARGRVDVLDRMTDRIRRRGENISPCDIESAAAHYEGVTECVAVGVPSGFAADDDIKLCVVTASGQIDQAAMLGFLAARLPHFMVPRYIELLPALPRTPTNKVRRSELRKSGVSAATWDRKAAGIDLRQLARALAS
ncbi:MAG: AMP-binding protein [Rubrivivax sp.]